MTGKELVATEEEREVELAPHAVRLSDVAIANVVHNIEMSKKLVLRVLEPGLDWGRLPGMASSGLYDSGASKINAAFNCYSRHVVLHHVETKDLIIWAIQAELIHRPTQEVMATGVGTSSTREPKHYYRWAEDPAKLKYTEEEIKELKTRQRNNKTQYQVVNPEFGELSNTLLKMAAKRAEVDAAQSLPGVASALKLLFTGGQLTSEPPAGRPTPTGSPGQATAPSPASSNDEWSSFWSNCNKIGLNREEVHRRLGVNSAIEWVELGRTLADAIEVLSRQLAKEKRTEAAPEEKKPSSKAEDYTEANIASAQELEAAAWDCFVLEPAAVWAELNYTNRNAFEEAQVERPWDCWLKIKAVR